MIEKRTFRFEYPKQVKFLDFGTGLDTPYWHGGIAVGPDIICGCCGGIIELADLWSDWDNFKNEPMYQGIESPIIIYDYWVDISDCIKE